MDHNVGEGPVDLQEKKEAYREEAEEDAEEDHLSPSYASILTLPSIAETVQQINWLIHHADDGGSLQLYFP